MKPRGERSVLKNKIKLVYLHYYKNTNRRCTDGYVSSVLVLSVFSLRKKTPKRPLSKSQVLCRITVQTRIKKPKSALFVQQCMDLAYMARASCCMTDHQSPKALRHFFSFFSHALFVHLSFSKHEAISDSYQVLMCSLSPLHCTASTSVMARDMICPASWSSGSGLGCPGPTGIRPHDSPQSMECDGPGSGVEEEAPSFRSRSSTLVPDPKCRAQRAKSCLPPAEINHHLSLADNINHL